MKKLLIFLSVIAFALFLVGCNNSNATKEEKPKEETTQNEETKESEETVETSAEADDLTAEFQAYADKMKDVYANEAGYAFAIMGVLLEENPNMQEIADSLNNEFFPAYKEHVSSVEQIETTNVEITNLHEIYIEAVTSSLEGYTQYVDALLEENEELKASAEGLMTNASLLLTQWEEEFAKLAEKTGVENPFLGELNDLDIEIEQ